MTCGYSKLTAYSIYRIHIRINYEYEYRFGQIDYGIPVNLRLRELRTVTLSDRSLHVAFVVFSYFQPVADFSQLARPELCT